LALKGVEPWPRNDSICPLCFSYFPDDAVNSPSPKPWSNTSPQAALDFYNHKEEWYSTWKGEESALQVDYVKVWAL
jgi:hypothetical protein